MIQQERERNNLTVQTINSKLVDSYRVLFMQSTTIESLLKNGQTLLNLGNPKDALVSYDKALEIYRKYPAEISNPPIAQIYINKGVIRNFKFEYNPKNQAKDTDEENLSRLLGEVKEKF